MAGEHPIVLARPTCVPKSKAEGGLGRKSRVGRGHDQDDNLILLAIPILIPTRITALPARGGK